MKRIPTSYFNLPKPKELLPLAYQELNSRVRCLFPLDLSELNIPLSEVMKRLREHYSFKQIPNDFFKPKPKLPLDTSKIKTNTTFSYPIENATEAMRFVQETRPYYQYNLPLPTTIMVANPTNKPWLPEDPSLIEDFNLILPITSPKLVEETARMLRQYYYFIKLPET